MAGWADSLVCADGGSTSHRRMTSDSCCRPLICVAAYSSDRLPPTCCGVVADLASYTIRPPRYILVPAWVVCSSK